MLKFGEFDQRPMEVVFLVVFFNFDKYRPEVDCGVISGVDVDNVTMDVHVEFVDSRLIDQSKPMTPRRRWVLRQMPML